MTLIQMIGREIQRAKWNTLLCLLAVTLATGVLVAMVAVSRASMDAARVLMKEVGFNLLITPPGTDPARYQALDFQDFDMPEEYVSRMAGSTVLARHFVGKYQKRIEVDGCTVVLTGVLPEASKSGKKKPMPTAYDVPRGRVFIGSAAARALRLEPGDPLIVMGKQFTVDRILKEVGAIPEDIRVFTHLHDVQALLGREGRINAIDALSCQCPGPAEDVVAALTASVHEVLPDVQVQPYHSILLARLKTRHMVGLLAMVTLILVMVGAALAIWGLTWQNVRNRHREIGVLRALGLPDGRIAALFIGKIFFYSIPGAVLGCLLGYGAAHALNVTGGRIANPWEVMICLLIATPLTTALIGCGPIVGGLMQETTDLMREGAG